MKRLVLAPKARADLFDIDAYISERNPLAAERLIERLVQAMRMLVRMPMVGRPCDDLGLTTMRRFVVEKQHIFYVLDGNDLRVVRVIHGRRDVTTEVRQ
jgi:toxin ParE1/3/4